MRGTPTPDNVSDARRANMRAIKGKDTRPELIVRRMLHRVGYRFRLHSRVLPGRPDIVFPARRKAIEVRGCFWHRHSDPLCRNAVLPRTRRKWWEAKLAANVARDGRNLAMLEALGWEVLVIWECEVASSGLTGRLASFLGPPVHYGSTAGQIAQPGAAT